VPLVERSLRAQESNGNNLFAKEAAAPGEELWYSTLSVFHSGSKNKLCQNIR
jgi:hypothetical protein